MSVDVGGSTSQKSDPNVVPLCDILLVLLIIFMVITPVSQRGIDIQLPETQTEGPDRPSSKSGIVLTMESDRTLKINQDPVPMEMLESRLREIFGPRPDKTIFIRADKNVKYSEVMQLLDIAKGAGVEVLGVMTQVYESNPQ